MHFIFFIQSLMFEIMTLVIQVVIE
jgi:hypothetical protein